MKHERGHDFTMICGKCEHEWDADGTLGRDTCPACGCHHDHETHLIRDERLSIVRELAEKIIDECLSASSKRGNKLT